MYFFYILKKYIKNFLIILISFSLLYTIVDIMFNISKIPSSSNLFILYSYYIFLYSITLLYPLVFVFAFLLTLSQMIKFNELVSFYSLGFYQKQLIKPIVFFSFFFIIVIFILLSTKLAYSAEYAQAIKNAKKLNTTNIFLKYNNSVIYIKKLNPVLKEAEDMYVFYLKNKKLYKYIYAKNAQFIENRWITNKADVYVITDKKWKKNTTSLIFLQNFKPKIISNLQKLRDISFYDAYLTIKYFNNVNINKILSIVFYKIFTPLSMVGIIIFIFYIAPIHIRISNVTLFMIKSISLSILFWGIILLIYKFAKQGVLQFWTLTIPFFVILAIDLYIRRKYEF